MTANLKKYFAVAALVLLAAGLIGSSSCGGRETIKIDICKVSSLLPSENCKATEEREYYKDPLPGDAYKRPTTTCDVCKPDDPPDPPIEYVTVDICKVSSLLPGENCLATVSKTYVKGQQPTKLCDVCQAPIVYPAKSKRPFWVFVPELLTANGDRPAFLERIRKEGAWGVRIFLLQSWSTRVLYPYLQAVYNGIPVTLQVKKEGWSSIVRDLTKWNAEYFTALETLRKELEQHDLGLIATLTDDCSIRNDRVQRHNYPFMGSIQTLSAAEDWPYLVPAAAKSICTYSPNGLYSTYRYQWHQAWVAKIIPILKAHSNLPLWIEVDNEFSRLGWAETAKEPGNWYAMMKGAIIAAGVPQSRIVHSCVKADFDIIKANIGLGVYSQHGVVLPAPSINHIPAAMLARTMLSGDGGFNGHSATDLDSFGKKGISAADAVALAQYIKSRGLLGYEWMPRIGWKQNDCLVNLDLIMDMGVPKAMIAEFNK